MLSCNKLYLSGRGWQEWQYTVPVQIRDQLIFVMTHSRSKVSDSYIGLLWPPEKYKQQHPSVTKIKKEIGIKMRIIVTEK